MKTTLKHALAVCGVALAAQAAAQITFYENDNFDGRRFNAQREVNNLRDWGFNDRASSVVIDRDTWEVCENIDYGGRCVVLRPGNYASLGAMGLNDKISSVRMISSPPVADNRNPAGTTYPAATTYPANNGIGPERQATVGQGAYDARRRPNERLYQARVVSARAVMADTTGNAAGQRCWVEREQVEPPRNAGRGEPNVPGAVIGAVLGGILGHQVGGGTGKDLATVAGAVAGGAVGANVNRGTAPAAAPTTQEVRRCEPTAAAAGVSGEPAYWDVTYNFRGTEHRVQMTTMPGATVTVNRQGEPRI